jgi:hypothetical protein
MKRKMILSFVLAFMFFSNFVSAYDDENRERRCVPGFLISFVRQMLSSSIILFVDSSPSGTPRPHLPRKWPHQS